MLRRSVVPPRSKIAAWVPARRGLWIASVVIVTVSSAGVLLASSAFADPSAGLRNAVASARSPSCAPMRYNPIVERVAEISNRTSDNWLDLAGRNYYVADPKPGLKDLGYGGDKNNIKGQLLSGADKIEAEAIHGALLEYLYDKSDDCTFTDFGVSMLRNERTGYYLASIVLAGHY